MKLPTSLVLLATLGVVSTSRRAESDAKRELLEGNYGSKRQILTKDVSPGIVYAKDYSENAELPPGNDVFGARHQQISKISDLLAGAGAPFEEAVANHLSSPVSIYQRLASSPYQVSNQEPFQESQATYSNLRSNENLQNHHQHSQNSETAPNSAENELPQTHFHKLDFTIGRPNFNLDLGRPRGFSVQGFLNPEPRHVIRMFVKPEYTEQTNQQFFPVEPQGPFRRPGQFIPAQFSQKQSLYQLIPMQQSLIYQTQRRPEDSVENQQQVKHEVNERRQIQKPVFASQQGYHAHPNGAISFASFTQNNESPQTIQRPIKFFLLPQLQSSTQEEIQSQPQEFQQLPNHQSNVNYIQNPQNYQPQYQSNYFQQYIPQNEQQPPSELLSSQQSSLTVQPRQLNPLQHQPLLSNAAFSPLLQPLHHVPAFRPIPNTIYDTNKPLSAYRRLPENPSNLNPQISQDSDQSHQTSSVSERSAHTKSQQLTLVPVFLPTTLQPITNTPTSEDQTLSHTTTRPETVEKSNDTSKPTQTQSLLDDEEQLLTVQPLIRHKTESDSRTPKHSAPQTVHTSPRHLVTIQKQELREITLEPAFQPLKYARILHPQFLIQQHNLLNEQQSHKNNVQPTVRVQLSSAPQKLNIQQEAQDDTDHQQIIHEKRNEQNSTHTKGDSENSQTEQLTTSQPESSSEKPQSHSQNIQTNLRQTLIYRLKPENKKIQKENQLQDDPFQPTSDESLESLPLGTLQLFPQSQELSQQEYSSSASPDFPSVQYYGKYAQSLFGEYPR